MAIRKILILLLCLLACNKLYCEFLTPPLPLYNEHRCTEDTKRETQEIRHCNQYCGYYRPIISRTISCRRILIEDLKFYEEPREDYPSSHYPLTLKVIDSVIPELPTSTFKNLKNLTVLYMKTIMPAAFNYLDQIKEIYLGQNELTTVSDGIFNTLIMLEKLDLSENQIETVTNHAFVGVSLKNLDLNHNNISGLEEVLLNSIKYLSALDMSYNNLSNITSLYRLSVQNLNLSHNNIDFVDFGMLQEATFIDFSFNNITRIINFNTSRANSIILSHNGINDFERNDNVNVLDIGYNNIKIISNELLSKSLTEFYVSFNFISSFNAVTFFGLHSLTHLYLDNNNLSSVPNSCFKDLNSLTHLNLSGNKLTYFKFGTFDNLVSLQVLDISKNDFKELPQFHSLSKLTHLFIQNNEISNIDPYTIFQQFPNLIKINLNNNTWSCKKLANIVHRLKSKTIDVPNGNFLEESNIYGIKCYETFENSNVSILKNGINLDNSKLNSFFNEDFTKTLLYKYFNQDFKQTEFFKYLESLKISINASHTQDIDYATLNKILREVASNSNDMKDSLKNSEMYNYLNADFKNTSFFKYLEHFRLNVNKSEKLDDGKLDKIASLLKHIAEELKNISSINNSNEYLGKTDMYNYLNKDFKTSNFYRYLENLNTRNNVEGIHLDDISDSTIEKLINPHEKIIEFPNYTGLLSVIAVSLLIIICIMTAITYRQFYHINKYDLKKEEVELI